MFELLSKFDRFVTFLLCDCYCILLFKHYSVLQNTNFYSV